MKFLPEKQFIRFLLLLIGCLVASLAIFSMFIKKGTDVVWINGQHNILLDIFFYLITSLGNGLIVIPALLITLISKIRFALATAIAFSLLGIACALLKRVFNLPRPIAYLDNDLLHFINGVNVHSHHSFPSGHTASIFCLVVLVSIFIKSRRVAALLSLTALLVGMSRIYLLQHFLMDVAAGAFLGSVIGFIAWHFTQKINWPWLENRLNISFSHRNVQSRRQAKSITSIGA